MAGEEGAGKAGNTFCLAQRHNVWADSPKPLKWVELSLELLVPNLGSTWPLSSSFLSIKVIVN